MFFAVTVVQPLHNYKLKLTFKNGEQKFFYMKPHLEKGLFKDLKTSNFSILQKSVLIELNGQMKLI